MPTSLPKPPELTSAENYEFESYVQSFTSASDRVRHVIIVSLVASILVFAAYRNAHEKGWLARRIELARLFQKENLINTGPAKVAQCSAMKKPTKKAEKRCHDI